MRQPSEARDCGEAYAALLTDAFHARYALRTARQTRMLCGLHAVTNRSWSRATNLLEAIYLVKHTDGRSRHGPSDKHRSNVFSACSIGPCSCGIPKESDHD